MYKYYKYVRVAVVFFSISTALFFGSITIAYIKLADRSVALAELSAIKTCVNTANLHIRNASIAPTPLEREKELAKRFEMRKRVDAAIVILDKQKFRPEEFSLYSSMKVERNTAYRASQNTVVSLILQGVADHVLWPSVVEYQKHQVLYTSYIEKLAQLVIKDIEGKYRRLLEYLMGFIGFAIILANIGISILGRKPYERRSCKLCGCDLPQKISLTISQELDGKVGPVRVCETCYFKNIVSLKIPEVSHVPSKT
jgi:hypothetical protein